MILACLAFAVAAAVEIKINGMAPPQPDSQEGFLQVLNLANDEVKVTVLGNENSSLLEESIKSFQTMPHYSKLHLKTKREDFHFQLKYHNLSVYTEHSVEEKKLYTLIIREDGKSISSMMVKDAESRATNGMTAMRFGCQGSPGHSVLLNLGSLLICGVSHEEATHSTCLVQGFSLPEC